MRGFPDALGVEMDVVAERFFSVNLDLLCIAGLDGRFLRLNKAWETILGYATGELEQRNFLEFVHPEDLEATRKAMQVLGDNQPVLNFVNRYRCHDGSYRHIEWRSQPYDGVIYAAARDITDRLREQALLVEKEENFRTFFETMDDLVFVVAGEGTLLHTNRAVREKLGYSEAELLTKNVFDVHPTMYRSEAEVIFDEMFKGFRAFCPLPLQRKDGSHLPVETRVWFGKWNGIDCIFGISKDLSKQQAALEMFHKLFDDNPALMVVSNLEDRKIMEVNNTFLDKLGYTREEVLGNTSDRLGLFVHPDRQREVAALLARDGQVRNEELELRKKSGERLTGLFSGEVIDNQGEERFLTVMVDITRQKRQEEQMRYKEKLLLAVASTTRHLLDEHEYRHALQTCFNMLGTAAGVERVHLFENRMSQTGRMLACQVAAWNDILPSQDSNPLLQEIPLAELPPVMGCLERGEIFHGNVRHIEDEETREVLSILGVRAILLIPLHVRQQFWGFLGFGSIEERNWSAGELATLPIFARALESAIARHQAEEELERERKHMLTNLENQRRFYEQILDAVPDLIFFKDVNSIYLGSNRAFAEDFIGMKQATLIGKSDLDFVPDRSQARFFREMDKRVLDGGKSHVNEEQIRLANGHTVIVETMKTPFFDEHGAMAGLIGISRDISERKVLEHSLMDAKKQADDANAMKSQFLANMSHEIRTPMNGIVGFLELLQRTELTEEQIEYLREANVSTEILLTLINDILCLSKIEAGKLVLEHTDIAFPAFLEDTLHMFLPKAKEKGLQLHLNLLSDIPAVIAADQIRLRQILVNLLSNAVKFTDQGEIHMSVQCLERKNGQAKLSFQIRDTGIGISQEAMAHLYEPFVQADGTISQRYGGTGLGLAICHELVKRMQGDIQVESILGAGTLFMIELMVEDRETMPGAVHVEATPAGSAVTGINRESGRTDMVGATKEDKKMVEERTHQAGTGAHAPAENHPETFLPRILLVEDNSINRKLVINMLKHKGYTCDIAVNGMEAVQAASDSMYDIIFMDCMMPVMDGFEATRRIRGGQGRAHAPRIIAMTANAMEGDREKCLAAGMDDYISKPMEASRFFGMIEAVRKDSED